MYSDASCNRELVWWAEKRKTWEGWTPDRPQHSGLAQTWFLHIQTRIRYWMPTSHSVTTTTAPSVSVLLTGFLRSGILPMRGSSSESMLSAGDIPGRERTTESSSEFSSWEKQNHSGKKKGCLWFSPLRPRVHQSVFFLRPAYFFNCLQWERCVFTLCYTNPCSMMRGWEYISALISVTFYPAIQSQWRRGGTNTTKTNGRIRQCWTTTTLWRRN